MIFEIFYEITPILISIFLLYVMRIRNNIPHDISSAIKRETYWEDKIKYQISKYNIQPDEREHIIKIVEDVNSSINFIGSFFSILIGIILIIIKESLKQTNRFYLIEYFVLFFLVTIYVASLWKLLFRMKGTLMNNNMKKGILRRLKYERFFEIILWIGYVSLLVIIFKYYIIN